MLDFDLDQKGRCELCDLTIKENRSDGKLEVERKKILKKVSHRIEERKKNKKKEFEDSDSKEKVDYNSK